MRRVEKKASLISLISRTDNIDDVLASYLWQDVKQEEIEILLLPIDEKSGNEVEKRILEIKNALGIKNWQIHPVYGRDNCSNRNKGAEIAEGKALIFVDGDQILSSNLIKAHIEASKKKRFGVGIANISAKREDGIITCDESPWVWDMGEGLEIQESSYLRFTAGLTLTQAIYLGLRCNLNKLEDYVNLSGRNFSIRRDDFLKLGGFDMDLCYSKDSDSRGWEDVELGLRGVKQGYGFTFVPCWAVHIKHDEALKKDDGKANAIKMVRKHPWFIEERKDWFYTKYNADIEGIKKEAGI